MTPSQKDIIAFYQIRCREQDIKKIAEEICFEQTVEVPKSLITESHILQHVVADVHAIEKIESQRQTYRVAIRYNSNLANAQLSQLLNLVYGNISLKPNTKLTDLHFPSSFLAQFTGPNFGIEGLRELTNIWNRPLLATALKPRGATIEALSEMAFQFARGGGDLVKDDHNLVDTAISEFSERIARCNDAVQRANEQTGKRCIYLPNLSGSSAWIEECLHAVKREGIVGVMVSPMLLGLENVRQLAQKHKLVLLAHPTFSGSFFQHSEHGTTPALLLGKLFRLAGIDISVFPNIGGRFSLGREDCHEIAGQLVQPFGELKSAWPAPAGGMGYDDLIEMVTMYGNNAVFLIGGGLLQYDSDLRKATEAFLARIESCSTQPKAAPFNSGAYDTENFGKKENVRHKLAFQAGFSWLGRSKSPYKEQQNVDFQGISRQELIGQFGEQTAFDLRYFEIEPNGYSSFEQHAHTHAIICVRGQGRLILDGDDFLLNPLDIGYVGPNDPHELRNTGNEPFGFLCIVDHDRDRPIQLRRQGNTGKAEGSW